MKATQRLLAGLVAFGLLASLASLPGPALAQEEAPPTQEPTSASEQGELAPLYDKGSDRAVPGQYIVVLKEEAGGRAAVAAAADQASARGAQVRDVYSSALKGYAARLTPEMVEALRQDPRVAYIEADQVVSLNDESGPRAQDSQSGPVWGLDRIDQVYGTNGRFYYPAAAGAGVHVYVIDSGMRLTHTEFGGRASLDFDYYADGQNGLPACEPHGTHVAGTIGGVTYGVAKNVSLHAVRVLDCYGYGTWSSVIAGLDWVAQNHTKPAVANLSLGGGASAAVDAAVRSLIASGVTVVAAAGNEADNACLYSPGRVSTAITVGATDTWDIRAYFSNYGSCLDIFAPGVDITSAVNDDDQASASWPGTSMAAPHVAGVAALYLAGNPAASPAAVASFLVAQSTKNVVSDPAGSPNRFLFLSNTLGGAPLLLNPPASALTSDATPELAWKGVYYADTYQVQYAREAAFLLPSLVSGISETACTLGPLDEGRWYWRARSLNAYGAQGAWSAARSFTVDTTPPAPPLLSQPADGAQPVGVPAFRWQASAGAYRYQFQYGADALDPENYLYRSGELASPAHKPPDMGMMAPYYWFVRAKDRAGNWSDWSAPFTVTVIPPKPGATLLRLPLTNHKTDQASLSLSWNAALYGNTYQVQVDDLPTFASPDHAYTSDPSATSLLAGPLATGKWYWRARAVNLDNESGPWSASRSFTVYPTFETGFNTDGDLEGWVGRPGAPWNAGAGSLYTAGLDGWYASSASYGATAFTDFTYTARMKMEHNPGQPQGQASAYGLLVRGAPSFDAHNNWMNAYYFTIYQFEDAQGSHRACYTIDKLANGARLSQTGGWLYCPEALKFNDWNTLTVYASGANFKFYINDTCVWGRKISGLANGQLGVFTWRPDTYSASAYVDWATAGAPLLPAGAPTIAAGQPRLPTPPGAFP